MIFHIAKREIYDNMMSLRFALTTLLLLVLMVVNAIGHLGEYQRRTREYRGDVSQSLDRLRGRADNFYHLVRDGPGRLFKKPTPLTFCAGGGEDFLPQEATGGLYGLRWQATIRNEKNEVVRYGATVTPIWGLDFVQSPAGVTEISPHFTKIDWTFIIAYLLSLVAILFTFDAISGERERGILRLILANSVPRDVVLLGKFIGALGSIGLPFLIAALINLFLLSTSGSIHFGAGEWGRLGLILLIASVFLCIFIALGLLVSARVHQSEICLTILLLVWTVVVVLTPATLGSLAGRLKPVTARHEYHGRVWQADQALKEAYNFDEMARTTPISRDIPATKATSQMSELMIKTGQTVQRINLAHLRAQMAQVQLSRRINRISPSATVQYAAESLAGTGLPRHLDFVDGVVRYADAFQEFLIETDAADPESPHAIGVRIGASNKPVNFEAIPKFEDRPSFSGSLNAAILDILLLVLFLVGLSAGAYLSFLRVDV